MLWSSLPLQVEGQEVAYRGRILIQITSTQYESLPHDEVIVQPISPSVSTRLFQEANFSYPKKYKLFALMLSANMVHPHNDAVEFEVSIGE